MKQTNMELIFFAQGPKVKVKPKKVEYLGEQYTPNKPKISKNKNKKYTVLVEKNGKRKLVHFGDKRYKHNYSDKARKNYLKRSAGIRNKQGKLTADDPFSPNYWSRRVLWKASSKLSSEDKK